ncbi:MAG: tyrosine-type recombinase/integrase [Gemmatimonadetes bacterium]|nr:tyrosine-type recombinase/integrase [Gemmatimonadota bacterium]
MRRPRRLSARFVKTVTQPGRYGDGHGGYGLSLFVKQLKTDRLSKTWSQRIRIHGRVTNLGLGRYPIVTLAHARKKALQNLRAIEHGQDPRGGGIPTFAEAVEKVIAIHRAGWKAGSRSEQAWRESLTRYAFRHLGAKRMDRITTADIMATLLANDLWSRKPATAKLVRQRIGAVMKWAVAKGYRADNPAGDAIAAALPKNNGRVQHHKALAHDEVAAALAKVRASASRSAAKLALEFLALTACRSGEVREARWEEVDLETATWTIPHERMKGGREHRVPLSESALKVLAETREVGRGARSGQLLFPSRTGKPLGTIALSRLTRSLGFVPHGLRTSFRNWCAETGVRREVAERCLAHVVQNQAERAYSRTDLLDRRRDVMEAWGSYIGGGGNA